MEEKTLNNTIAVKTNSTSDVTSDAGNGLTNLRSKYIRKEGWLELRGKYIKTWRRRYFILFDRYMFGFKKIPRRDFNRNCNHRYILPISSPFVQIEENLNGKTNIFTLTFYLKGNKEFKRTFSAPNDEEHNSWTNAINACNDRQYYACFPYELENDMYDASQQDRDEDIETESGHHTSLSITNNTPQLCTSVTNTRNSLLFSIIIYMYNTSNHHQGRRHSLKNPTNTSLPQVRPTTW